MSTKPTAEADVPPHMQDAKPATTPEAQKDPCALSTFRTYRYAAMRPITQELNEMQQRHKNLQQLEQAPDVRKSCQLLLEFLRPGLKLTSVTSFDVTGSLLAVTSRSAQGDVAPLRGVK
eukprot:1908589-Amphidinium_carterae.1